MLVERDGADACENCFLVAMLISLHFSPGDLPVLVFLSQVLRRFMS